MGFLALFAGNKKPLQTFFTACPKSSKNQQKTKKKKKRGKLDGFHMPELFICITTLSHHSAEKVYPQRIKSD